MDISFLTSPGAIEKESFLFRSNYDRRWAKIKLNNRTYFIGWRSNLIDPFIKETENNTLIIAVDENLVIIDSIGNVKVNVETLSPFLFASVFNNYAAFLFEIQLLIYDLSCFKEVSDIMLEDLPESCEFYEEFLIIKCMGGRSQKVFFKKGICEEL